MSTRIRGLPPRVALRIKDSATGSYPSVARVGDDSRLGFYPVFYDDLNTINFVQVDADISSSTKYPPKFDLRQPEGRYSSTGSLIAYWRFEPADIRVVGATHVVMDRGVSGTLHLTATVAGVVLSSSNTPPFTGTVQSAGPFNSPTNDSFTYTGFSSQSLAFGNGTTGFARTISCWINKIQPIAATSSVLFARSGSSISLGDEYEIGVFGTTGSNPGTGASFGTLATTGSLFFRVYDNSANRFFQAVAPAYGISGSLQLNKWYHLAITWTGLSGSATNTTKFYIDGQFVSGSTTTQSGYVAPELTNALFNFGSAQLEFGGPGKPWGGLIDDFAIFDRVLGEHTIKEIAGYSRGLSLPVGLDGRSKFSKPEERTDIFAPGLVRKGIFDNFVSFTPGEDLTPFNETFRPEQNQTSSYYLTGTPETEFVYGFSSKLASKTQINMSFNVSVRSIMPAQTASIYYYNNILSRFEQVGGADASTNPSGSTSSTRLPLDHKLFNALGIPVLSGTTETTDAGVDNSTISAALINTSSKNITTNANFSATSSQIIKMSNFISHPFLVEKMIVMLPVSCSSGWFNDKTRYVPPGFSGDVGGPCVVISLLNQFGSELREIVVSGTIIPSTDNISERSGSQASGFLSFGTPGAVVSAMGETVAQIETTAGTAHGFVGNETFGGDFFGSSIAMISPFGRAMNAKPSGRSYLGREFTTLPLSSSFKSNLTLSGQGLHLFIKNSVSPYILHPTDNLIFAVSKHRPVLITPGAAGATGQRLTGSHEFALNSGVVNIKLYGSLIKDEREFHDTLNQNLTSDAVHESIHFDNPVVDQFDIEPKSSFSGSYVAEFFTGSMFATSYTDFNGFRDGRRGVRANLLSAPIQLITRYPVTSLPITLTKRINRTAFNRNVSIISNEERYFDTLVPNPVDIVKMNGGEIVAWGTTWNALPIGRATQGAPYDFDQSWDFLFPFESRYKDVPKVVNSVGFVKSDVSINGTAVNIIRTDISIIRSESIGNTESGSMGAADHVWPLLTYPPHTGSASLLDDKAPDKDTVLKALFGKGDGQYGEPLAIPDRQAIIDIGANLRFFDHIIVRGFKYGLLNCIKENKKYIFRRDHYGHYRDMLEQGKDSKMFIESDSSIISSPVKIGFRGSDGLLTDGETTFSSNVSTEATSSVPYFDGDSRNRGDLPSVSLVA